VHRGTEERRLRAMADEIVAAEPELLAANAQDVEKAKASGSARR
jgi:gamma-glutamyl phosphate reductase